MGPAFGFLIFGSVILGTAVAIVAISMMRRYRRTDDGPMEPISLLVAEHAAEAIRKRSLIFASIGFIGLGGLLAVHIPVFPVVFAIWLVPAVRGLAVATTALRVLGQTGAVAYASGSLITIKSDRLKARLYVTPSELAAAKQRGVPSASTH